MADSPPEPATPSADLATDYTAPATIPADPPVATESATIEPLPDTVSADSIEATSSAQPTESPPPQSPTDLVPPSPISPPEETLAPSPQSTPQEASTPSSEPAEGGSISVSSPPNEPSQVQPTVPESAPSSQVPEEASQWAGIKLEPLEGTQNVPLADSEAPVSPKTSFGDFVSDQPAPVSPPESPQVPQSPQSPISSPSTPKTSFGDLVGIPPVDKPTINIQPIEVPKPVQPQQSPQSQVDKVVEAKADFSSKRQQALQVRRKKREDHLAKILALVSQKGKIRNSDVRDTFRVSQSTASDYLHTLVKDGKIKKEGKAKATVYLL